MDRAELVGEFLESLNDEDKEEWLDSRKNCDASLYYFIKEMGGFIKDAGGDATTFIHKPTCDFWQDDTIKRKFVLKPRGWLKTTCLTKWGSIWTYLQDNERRVIIPTEIERRIKDWMRWMGDVILKHERLRWVYPELRIVDKAYTHANPYSSEQILLPREGFYDSVTLVGASIHGSSQGGHYDYIEPDDICGEKAASSLPVMEDSCSWFDNIEALAVESDSSKPNASVIRGKGTHWASGDTYCYIQQKFPEYKWMITPALKDENLEDKDNIKYIQNPEAEHGESNWAWRNSTKYYLDMLSNPETRTRCLCQELNNPGLESEANKFNEKWLKWFQWDKREDGVDIICKDESENSPEQEVLSAKIPEYGFLDIGGFKEIKLKKTGSQNVVMVGGQLSGSIKKFITWSWIGKLQDFTEFVKRIIDADEARNPIYWNIEPYSQHEFIRRAIIELAKIKFGKTLKIYPIKANQGDLSLDAKTSRITALIPIFRNGEIYLHESYEMLLYEYKNYPASMTIDGLDSLGWLRQLHWSEKIRGDVGRTNAELEQRRITALGDSQTGY